ncbi:hypothetical protein AAG570_012916, partial [Ranatra chinensis]
IKEYLSIAPHENKFYFRETGQVLHRSVEGKSDFSAYRATAAWTAIAAYAHNLLAQPWRKEFREIKTYSGFYKHHVEGSLVGGEIMLEMMGYRHSGNSSMILEGPVDPDRVANVSKDSIVALVECQIMRSIYGDLVKAVGDCSWLEVLQYRETHVGSTEQALQGLTYRMHQRRYQDQYHAMDSYGRYQHLVDTCPYISRYCRYNTNVPPGYPAPSQQQLPPVCPVYTPNGYNYGSVQNGYSNPLPAQPSYSCSVPTGQLIELDGPLHSKDNVPQGYSGNTHRRSSSDHITDLRDRYIRSANNSDDYFNKKSSKVKEEGWDSWGYVYQSLENKKANQKDDLLSQPMLDKKQMSILDIDEGLKVLSVNDSHTSSVPDTIYSEKQTYEDKHHDTRRPKHEFTSNTPGVTQTLGREIVRKNNDNYLTLRVKLNDKWECTTCTFHNPEGKEVCEMCGKSKTVGNEVQPLTSGGRQCPQCTLVNEKGVTTCDACGTCLKDSPTYI